MTGEHMVEMYDDVTQNKPEIKAKAELFGCEVRFADDRTLQIDLDSEEARSAFDMAWTWAGSQLKHIYFTEWTRPIFEESRNGNVHVTIPLITNVTPEERILLQSLLHSDLKRELLNFTRLKLYGHDLTCLFRPKPKMLGEGL